MRHGSNIDPPNRFETHRLESDLEHVEWDTEYLETRHQREIEYIIDDTQTIVTENKSPDLPFRYSLNPYRGCVHACSYCYARPTHEYLGFNAGLDFETKIVVKADAPELFRDFLRKKNWKGDPIAFSGVTDCYQPAERKYRLTGQCVEVALECCQPMSIVTKNALVVRDLEPLVQLAVKNLTHVYVSVTTLDPQLAPEMEPRTSIPEARLRAIRTLAEAGVPVGVMVAPVIPGLNDSEVPAILDAAKSAGASVAGYVLLRLPMTVQQVFAEWLERTQPLKAERILSRVRSTRRGGLNTSDWGERMSGSGEIADQIRGMFTTFKKKLGYDDRLPEFDSSQFRPPKPKSGQLDLF